MLCSFLRNGKIELPYDPVILLAGIHPRKTKTLTRKDIHSHGHCSFIHNYQDMEITEASINGGMDKEDVVYVFIR